MIIVNMGSAIAHWLGFQEKIGRSFMMNEDAIKYPLSDYLINEGNIDIKDINLEKQHPNFSKRLVDLSIINSKTKVLNNIFEIKLATSYTRQQKEQQRIFNDIIRLHYANLTATSKCYFIITGKSTHFQRDFKNFSLNQTNFYSNWFSFVQGSTKTFKVFNETDPFLVNIYTAFFAAYEDNYEGVSSLQLPKEITTKCEFITAFKTQFVPYMAGIWSIE